MDVMDLALEIQRKVRELECARKGVDPSSGEKRQSLETLAQKIGDASRTYSRDLAVTALNLSMGRISEFEGKTFAPGDLKAEERKSIAKGLTADSELNAVAAPKIFQARIQEMEAIKAEISALQTIYKRHENL